MDNKKNVYEIGEWVEIEEEHKGVILEKKGIWDNTHASYKISIYKDGKFLKKPYWFEYNLVRKIPLEGFGDARPILIDLALQTNDENWFKELVGGSVC